MEKMIKCFKFEDGSELEAEVVDSFLRHSAMPGFARAVYKIKVNNSIAYLYDEIDDIDRTSTVRFIDRDTIDRIFENVPKNF